MKNKLFLQKNTKRHKIRESIHGNFFYHISLNDKALCGKKETMITSIPIIAWGIKSHLHEKYCKECEEIFNKEK